MIERIFSSILVWLNECISQVTQRSAFVNLKGQALITFYVFENH